MKVHPLKPDWIFSGGESGNFNSFLDISYDGGQTWNTYAQEDNNAVNCLEFSPSNPSLMLIGKEGKIDRSLDSGQTWTTVFTPPHLMYIHAISFPFAGTNEVFAAGAYNNVGFAKDTAHLFYSENGGRTWRNLTKHYIPGCDGIMEMDIHDSILYFVTQSKGVYTMDVKDLPVSRKIPSSDIEMFEIIPQNGGFLVQTKGSDQLAIEVINGQGQTMVSGTQISSNTHFTTTSWKQGWYLVLVRNQTGASRSKKVMVIDQ